ncbi:MAG: fibronectin type III domain-containing protein, partial [Lachnospiraceae bacterium]
SEPSVQPSQKVSEPSEKPSQKPSEPSERPSQKPSEPSEEPSKDDTPSVERIYFSKNVITLNEGEKSEVVKVFAEMSDGKEENVDADKLVFTMEDETIASVTSEGIIKAQKSGQTILTAKMGKLRADCFIKVLQEQPSQPSEPSQSDKTLTVSQETVVLQAGESIALSADSDAEIIWETGNRLVVTVKSFSEGRIALVEAAENAPSTTVELFVSDGKTLKRISVTVIAKTTTEPSVPTPVEPVKTQLTLDKTSVSIHQKKKAKVVATVISDTLTAEDITVTTSDKKVAVAKNDNGTIIITAKKAGIAKITVNIKGVSSKKITVKVRPEKVTQIKKKILSKNSIQLKWKKQTDVTGYEVKILNKKKKLSYESCKLTGLKQKKKYKVMIRSYKSTKSGEVYSDTVTITVSTK